jgi:hypothetical protein
MLRDLLAMVNGPAGKLASEPRIQLTLASLALFMTLLLQRNCEDMKIDSRLL